MIPVPVFEEWLCWQIQHYTERLTQATTVEARAHLRAELYRLKQKQKALWN